MKTHQAKRVEIIIEAPMETRLTAALERAGVTGFTVLPVLGGSGRSAAGRAKGRSAARAWSPWSA
jgi:nitrogen regulatory protein PII